MLKRKIIGGIVIALMSVIANYPIYRDLQESVKVAQGIIATINDTMVEVKGEVDYWKNEVNTLQTRIDNVQAELTATIDSLKVEAIDKVDKEVEKVEKEAKDKIKQYIPGLPGF